MRGSNVDATRICEQDHIDEYSRHLKFLGMVGYMDVGQNGRPMWDHRCECLV